MLKDELKKRNITISLRIFEPHDLATGWEVKALVENPDVFEDFFVKYPLKQVECFDDYYLYLLTLKLQSLSATIPLLLQEEHKTKIAELSGAAENAIQALGPGSIIKYINGNIKEIFDTDISKHDVRSVTLDLIAKYNTGISKETFLYLCDQFGYMLIDRFESFESVFEREPDLFQVIFPSGKLNDIYPYRIEKTLDIWQHITLKGKSNLKNTVSKNIPVLFDDIVLLSKSATIDNVMQIEGTVRKFHQFLQRIQSPLANQFAQYAKNTEALLFKNITEQGQSFQYEIPVAEIVKRWKATASRESRLLCITHEFSEVNGHYSLVSTLDKKPKLESALIDLVSTNIPTDDYYTMSHQQTLSICASVGTGAILGIIRDIETASDFYSLLLSAIKYISDGLHVENEDLDRDVEQLISMVQLVINNHNLDEITVHSLCYGAAMFICALSEKLLRLFYINLVKDRQYVPINKATMGELLSDSNTEILNVFGFHHIKSLSFFLMQTQPKNVGYNFRNKLAHWSAMSVNHLTPTYVAQLLWLFTDILNTVLWHLLEDTTEGD